MVSYFNRWVGKGKALVNKGVALGQLKHSEEAVAVYDEVVRRFGDAPEAALRKQVGKALVYKGVTLAVSGRFPEAQATLETALTKYEGAVEPEIENVVRRARELLEQVKNAQEGGNEQTRG